MSDYRKPFLYGRINIRRNIIPTYEIILVQVISVTLSSNTYEIYVSNLKPSTHDPHILAICIHFTSTKAITSC